MLENLQAKVVEISSTDSVDETTGTHKWSENKKAVQALDKLNKDSNLTAGLEAVLRIAVGARVMLRRNVDTDQGLVNGALGTVKEIKKHHVSVQFDNTNCVHDIEKVKSKFIVLKKFFIYREQFPLILAYAITIHKCQGLSLDCAIMDLSNNIFSPGMAYVALSRVRTLSGVHLTSFDPESIMVSSVTTHHTRKRKLTGVCSTVIKPKKRKTLETGSTGSLSKKRSLSSKSDDIQKSKRPHTSDGNAQRREWSNLRFYPVNARWQLEMCKHLDLQYYRANRFSSGGSDRVLTCPNTRTV